MQTSDNKAQGSENGVIRQPVGEEGLAGTLFRPATLGPYLAAILLGESTGGLPEGAAAIEGTETLAETLELSL